MINNDNQPSETKRFSTILDLWIRIEKQIQQRTRRVSRGLCLDCQPNCCAEPICREALDSPFLHLLVQMQDVSYDQDSGWLGPRGCRLEYGRPLVCYNYFCEPILDSEIMRSSGLRELIRKFMAVSRNARGGDHLICVKDLKRLSIAKLATMCQKLEALLGELQDRESTLN